MTVLPIADKSTLDAVKTNVGSNADASSSTGSIHAKLKAIATSVSAQTPQFVKPSDTVRLSAPTERINSDMNNEVKVKKFIVGVTGAVRLAIQLKNNNDNTYYAYAYCYLNNAKYTTLFTASNSYVSLSQDIEGVKPGDIIDIRIKPGSSSVIVNIKNVTVCYDSYTLTTSGSVELD